jgi:aminoglycoside phosphotransferase (APT) family kinase protein
MQASLSELSAALRDAMRRRWGDDAEISNVEQATLGGSNRTLLFDATASGSRSRLVSREETFPGADKPFLTPATQMRAMALAHGQGLPVPQPVFAFDEHDRLGPGFVTRFSPGTALPRRILAETAWHGALLDQIASIMARLHALDVNAFTFLADVPESGDPVATMHYRIDMLEERHPALELGLRWLELHPVSQRTPGVVHGDFRTGNFLVDDGRITALLDWECCHLGSPAEDLGWFCTRSWRFGQTHYQAGGIATRQALIKAYQAAGGAPVSENEVRWWEIFGLIRWAMFNMLQAHSHVNGRRSPAYAACGRNVALMEYDLLMTLAGDYD